MGDGYDFSTDDLEAETDDKHTETEAWGCATECNSRPGCTSFEFGTIKNLSGCWTYTGVAKSGRLQKVGMATCIRKEQTPEPATVQGNAMACPKGYTQIGNNLAGQTSDRLSGVTDIPTCAAACDCRAGCTS